MTTQNSAVTTGDFNNLAAQIRQIVGQQKKEIDRLSNELAELRSIPRSPTEEIDRIPGRRLPSWLTKNQDFTTSQNGTRAASMNYSISQDGPFVMTHFPFALWRVTLPANATNYGRWRPVVGTDMPTETLATDLICLSYEMQDNGSQLNFQDNAIPPIFSRPSRLLPLPFPVLFSPQSLILLTPTYEVISFSGTGTATTGGRLVITLVGYRIFNR